MNMPYYGSIPLTIDICRQSYFTLQLLEVYSQVLVCLAAGLISQVLLNFSQDLEETNEMLLKWVTEKTSPNCQLTETFPYKGIQFPLIPCGLQNTGSMKKILTWLSTNLEVSASFPRTSFEGNSKLLPPSSNFVPFNLSGVCLLNTSDSDDVLTILGFSPITLRLRRLLPTVFTSFVDVSVTWTLFWKEADRFVFICTNMY